MVRIYYDTEFIDDGSTIELISIGMISSKGEEYYAINADLSLARLSLLDWHINNTVPSLPMRLRADELLEWSPEHEDWTKVRSKTRIRDDVYNFLWRNREMNQPAELWAWYGAYDHVAIAQLWGPMVNLPADVVPMYTNDLKQEMSRKEKLGNPRLRFNMPLHDNNFNKHNALDDARLLKKRAEWLEQF